MKKETIIGIVVCAVLVIAGIVVASVLISGVNSYGIEESEFVGVYQAPTSEPSILTINGDHTFTVTYYNLSGTWDKLSGKTVSSDECSSPDGSRSWLTIEAPYDDCSVLYADIHVSNKTYYPTYYRIA